MPSAPLTGRRPEGGDWGPPADLLSVVARTVSPRVEVHADTLVTLDVTGLTRLIGEAKAVAERLRRAAADHGILPVRIALAGTRTAAILLARARVGITVVPDGGEASALSALPLPTLTVFQALEVGRQPPAAGRQPDDVLCVLSRWGLSTLGDLAALPAAELSERLGQEGIWWQRVARGEDAGPLVPTPDGERFESTLELEWPIEGLEPLSFVLGRLLEPLCQRLERRDRGAAVLQIALRLVTRETHARRLELPAPMRDPRVLRTLLLLDLESHPAPAGIDAVTIAIDPTPGRIVQESLLARALPTPEQMSTLLARLRALMGEGRVGAPVVLDSHRPDACAIAEFRVPEEERVHGAGWRLAAGGWRPDHDCEDTRQSAGEWRDSIEGRSPSVPLAASRQPPALRRSPAVSLRRFRLPIAVTVAVDRGHPVSVRADRQGLRGGRVEAWAGPWRTSGDWWRVERPPAACRAPGWNREEWDVALGDGGVYRIFEDRDLGRWFIEGILD